MTTAIAPADVAQRLRAAARVNDPVVGPGSPAEMERDSPLWPDPARFAQIRRIAVTESGSRRVEEYFFQPAGLDHGLPIHPSSTEGLPVAIVYETADDGSVEARVYSAHQLVADRGPILPVDPTLIPERGPDDILGRYFVTLHSGALGPTLDLWEADGYMRHSNGETHLGREKLRAAFTRFYATGGIMLRYCNKTDAGAITALEAYMPSGRPAVAVYERGPTGLMQAARLYL